jgi:hypothetical protein
MRTSAILLAVTMFTPAGLALAAQAAPGIPAGPAAPAAAASSGTFRSAVYVKNAVSPSVALPTSVVIADVTGDGRRDLIVSTLDIHSDGGTTIAVYRQRDNGTLAAPVTAKTRDFNAAYNQIRTADLYRTGRKEILVPEITHVDVFAYRQGRVTSTSIPVPATDLTIADMNGDKRPDLLTSSFFGKRAEIYLGSAARTFRLWRTLTFQQNSSQVPLLSAADFNHDGRTDVAHQNGDSFSVRLQASGGRFSSARTYKPAPFDGVLSPVAALTVGDVTGDGRPDVITATGANRPGAGVEVFAGTGTGTFREPVVYPILDAPIGMTVAGLNGDGRQDLVIDHNGWNAIGVMLQTSKGTFAPGTLYPADSGAEIPAVGDLNGDGQPDIAIPSDAQGIAILYGK